MSKLLKLGVYVAAGVGTYEILRRYGLLQKAGEWLSEQVPEDYKQQAQQYADQLRNKAGEVGSQLRDRAQPYVEQAQTAVRQATGQAQPATAGNNGNSNGGMKNAPAAPQGGVNGPTAGSDHSGATITGPGRGSNAVTDETGGMHTSHVVGRGVVR